MEERPTAEPEFGAGRTASVSNRCSTATLLRTIILIGVALLFLWLTVRIDLVIFAGLLLAILLSGLSEMIAARLPVPRAAALAVVLGCIMIATASLAWFFSAKLSGQFDELIRSLPAAIDKLKNGLNSTSWLQGLIGNLNPQAIVSNQAVASGIFGVASTTLELVADLIVFVFIAIYAAADPETYVSGFLHLVPQARRPRMRIVLHETSVALWYWMMGRLFSMATIGIATGLGLWLLGIPVPAALGVLAALLTFVPYLGTVVSAIPPILLSLADHPQLAVYVVLLFAAIHVLEGYVLLPLVQKRAAHLPPAVTLGAQAILGTLIGIVGIALATPLAAACVVVVRDLYVEDVLRDDTSRPDSRADDYGSASSRSRSDASSAP